MFYLIIKNLGGLDKSSVASSQEVDAICHWFRKYPTQSNSDILASRECHGILELMQSIELMCSKLHQVKDEETQAQEADTNSSMPDSS